jgi:flavodoxin I
MRLRFAVCRRLPVQRIDQKRQGESKMKNITVIYWSGTGNTQAMAEAVGTGAAGADVNVVVKPVNAAVTGDILQADAVALGCPSMGCEVLEEGEMEPFVQSLGREALQGKAMGLFGSYDWGDGQWMRDWQERMEKQGVRLVAAGLTLRNTPDEAGLARCRELGAALAEASER